MQDETPGAENLADRLARLGYEVCRALPRGENAVATIVDPPPDLVLLDIRVSGAAAGVETAIRLRERMDLPVVLVAAASDEPHLRKAAAAKPFDYLVNPFEERDLHAAIQVALTRHRLEGALDTARQQAEQTARERTAQLAASEARFAAFARIGADWLWETDAQDRFIFFSTGLKKAGLDPNPRLGKTRRDGASPEPENLARIAELEHVVARREPFHNVLYRARTRGEAVRWCMISGEPVYGTNGEFVGYRGVGRDVEDEIATRRALESKTRILNAAFAATPDAVSVTNAERRGVEWNERLFELFDLDKAAALAHGDPVDFGLRELARRGEYGPGALEDVVRERRNRVAAIIAERGSLQYERQLKSGRWIEARLRAIEGGGWVSLYRDITERKRSEIALREINVSLAEVSPVGIFRTDADGGILEVNQRWCEITGMLAAAAQGDGWADAVHAEDRARVRDEWKAFVRGRSRFRGECRFLHGDGKMRWVVAEAMRIGSERDGGGYIGTITDITEQKQIELALRVLSTELASLEGAPYFAAAASHLAALLDAPMAYITRLDPSRPGELYTVAATEDGKIVPNFSYPVAGTPCADLLQGRSIVIGNGAQARYPGDHFLAEKGIAAYAGVPVLDPAGRVLGTVDVLSRRPFREVAAVETTLKIFGVAVGAALTRERTRRQYEDLFEFAPRALVMTERDGRIALANRRAERIFGWTRQEMIGQSLDMLVPGHLHEHYARLERDAARSGAAAQGARDRIELLCLRKDGAWFPAEIDLASVSTENGVLIAAAVEDITSRKAIETALETSRSNLADALESIDRGVILYDKDDRVVIFNSRFRDHFPGPAAAIEIGARFEDIFRTAVECGAILVPDGMTKEGFIAERLARHRLADGQVMTRKLGDGRILQVTEHAARNGGIIGIGADVTEQLRIEEQLRAIQKMEAIGQLTGGMAHDFNNYLGVIVGNLDLLKERKGDDPVASRYVDAALDGALRGAELTQSLLAFSRRKRLDPSFTDLNARADSIAKLLGRTLGERIEIVVALAPDLWPVQVDAAQLDSCIVNVATNARDAMPGGGLLKISTRNEILDEDYVRLNAGVAPGSYALIEIADSGVGMSAETLGRVFEPFFTTKAPGHGTGLGLSMTYGFVKQSGGHIKIYSEIDHGTTVRIYLPRATAAGIIEYAAPRSAAPRAGGTETILVVEDNEQLRATAVAQLASLGYRVLQAGDGRAALALLEQSGVPPVDLLFSDIVMPGGLDGYALAKRAVERLPGLKVLLTSGFPGEALARMSGEAKGFALIGKPYRKDDLARALRSALGS